jgi:hypothetical protein
MADAEVTDRPRSVRFRVVGLVFVVTVALGLVVALLLHRSFVAAERVAARHVVPGSTAVLRLDLEKVVLFAPVRRVLMPLVNASDVPKGKELEPRVRRLAERSELELGRDTRELLVNFGPGEKDWSVVAAGNYPEKLLPALAAVLAEEGEPWKEEGGALVSPRGVALGQASDGALVLGANEGNLKRALSVSSEHERLGIPLRGALSFTGDPRQVRWLGEATRGLGDLERVQARAEWSSPLEVEWTLSYTGAPPDDLERRLGAALEELLGKGEALRLERAVGKPRLSRNGKVVSLHTRWDHESLEIVANRVAALLGNGTPPALGR